MLLDCTCICLLSACLITCGKGTRWLMEYLCAVHLVTIRVIQTVTFERQMIGV